MLRTVKQMSFDRNNNVQKLHNVSACSSFPNFFPDSSLTILVRDPCPAFDLKGNLTFKCKFCEVFNVSSTRKVSFTGTFLL